MTSAFTAADAEVPSDLPISIVVCTRNRAGYLPTCLAHLAWQACRAPFEVIVVDNASTDDTPRLLREWCFTDPRFRAVQEPRLGLSAAKNTGVQLARGRLLLFTDDDVIVDPGWAEAYLEFFRRRGEDSLIAGGPIVPISPDLGEWPPWFDPCALPDLGLLDYGEERPLNRHEYVWGANMAIPLVHFRRVGLWDEGLGCRGAHRGTFEDAEFQDRLRARGVATWFCPGAKLQHRVSGHRIVPSRILGNAHGRGRNDFWKPLPAPVERPVASPHCRPGLGLWLARHTRFVFWAVIMAVCRKRAVFVRAHRAACSSGWSMEALRASGTPGHLTRTIAHSSLRVLGSVLRILRVAEQH